MNTLIIAGVSYSFTKNPNYRVKASAETLAQVLIPLAESGELTAAKLVEVSRPEDAPLHNEFEWDDTKAAQAYREHQGRSIIRCLQITVDPEQSKPIPMLWTPQYDSAKPEYTPITTILTNADKRTLLYQDALKELRTFKAKYSALEEFGALFDEMAKLGIE